MGGVSKRLDPEVRHSELALQFEQVMDRLRADVTQSIRAVQVQGALPIPVPPTGGRRLSVAAGRIAGFALYETTAAAGATALIYDGQDANGELILPITLGGGESTRDWFLPGGLSFVNGLYIVVTGAIGGAVYLGAME